MVQIAGVGSFSLDEFDQTLQAAVEKRRIEVQQQSDLMNLVTQSFIAGLDRASRERMETKRLEQNQQFGEAEINVRSRGVAAQERQVGILERGESREAAEFSRQTQNIQKREDANAALGQKLQELRQRRSQFAGPPGPPDIEAENAATDLMRALSELQVENPQATTDLFDDPMGAIRVLNELQTGRIQKEGAEAEIGFTQARTAREQAETSQLSGEDPGRISAFAENFRLGAIAKGMDEDTASRQAQLIQGAKDSKEAAALAFQFASGTEIPLTPNEKKVQDVTDKKLGRAAPRMEQGLALSEETGGIDATIKDLSESGEADLGGARSLEQLIIQLTGRAVPKDMEALSTAVSAHLRKQPGDAKALRERLAPLLKRLLSETSEIDAAQPRTVLGLEAGTKGGQLEIDKTNRRLRREELDKILRALFEAESE